VNTVVDVVETLGSEQFVYLDAGGDQTLVARMPAGLRLTQGRPLEIVILPDRLHFFDPDGETAITCVSCRKERCP
jgi:multiple sugar transport system ATP-binding protein